MLEPLIAEKMPQPTMLTCSRPPGSKRSNCASPRYILSPSPLRSTISASSTKSGTAVSV